MRLNIAGKNTQYDSHEKLIQPEDGEVEELKNGEMEEKMGGDTEPGERGGNRNDGMVPNETQSQRKFVNVGPTTLKGFPAFY